MFHVDAVIFLLPIWAYFATLLCNGSAACDYDSTQSRKAHDGKRVTSKLLNPFE